METFDVDLVILGTGLSASRVADKMVAEGKSVAIVEAREFGGTCALRGCNPKKVFVRAAELVDWAKRADGKLARSENVEITGASWLSSRESAPGPVKEKTEAKYHDKGIKTFSGHVKVGFGPQGLRVECGIQHSR